MDKWLELRKTLQELHEENKDKPDVENVTRFLLNLMEVLDGKPNSEIWVSVKERLPVEKINKNTRDFENVICATVFGDVRFYGYGSVKLNEPHFWHCGTVMDEYVTHWMPLPEMPSCGGGNDNRADAFQSPQEEGSEYVTVPFSWLVKFCTHIDFKEPLTDAEREKLWRQKLKQQFNIVP